MHGPLLATPALAATPADRGECAASADKPDIGFAACSRMIDDANVSAAERVEAYKNRGLSHEVLGHRAETLADFRKVQSIDQTDRVSKQQLRVLGF